MSMIGYPVTDDELNVVQRQADALVAAIADGDLDTAYIIGQTCHDPALLAMFAVETALAFTDEEEDVP